MELLAVMFSDRPLDLSFEAVLKGVTSGSFLGLLLLDGPVGLVDLFLPTVAFEPFGSECLLLLEFLGGGGSSGDDWTP